MAGSVYALLAVSEVLDAVPSNTSDPSAQADYLSRAIHLAHLATKYESLTAGGEMSTPDHPWSLYEGVAGMCCAWIMVLRKLGGDYTGGGMPGYADIVF